MRFRRPIRRRFGRRTARSRRRPIRRRGVRALRIGYRMG